MAADKKHLGEFLDADQTLAELPDDTTPPAEDATLITEPMGVDPEATLAEMSSAPSPRDDATMIEPGASASRDSADDRTVVIPGGAVQDNERTFLMGPAVDAPAEDETAATMIVPSVANARSDETMEMPQQRPGGATTDATLLGYAQDSDGELGDTRYDTGAATSSPDGRTVLQRSGAGTASGTATGYIPPEKAKEREYPNLGRFEIRKLLGQGAFGAVYLAYDPHLDRKVAIKVAKTGVLVGKQDVDRFMREARSAAQLRHPNIVPVYEVGQLPNTNFIAYEYVEGRTLGDLMKEKKTLSVEAAAVYTKKIASGLHYAHEHGIVHRDMKPDNVLLDAHDEPHIADFGLARRDEGDTTRTREGMFMGTPSYMSPEQASGQAHLADARSDVWSLGVMLQEMLTGVRPFRGNVTEVLVAVQNLEPPSVRTINRNIPADLETIVSKCLTKKIEGRYQSAQMLADELDRWLRGEPILARPISIFGRTWRWAKRNPEIAGMIGFVLLVFLLASVVSTVFGISATNARNLAHQQALERAEAQLNSVQTAEAASLPVLIESLGPYREELRPQLMELADDGELSDVAHSRVRLAAVALYPKAPQLGALIAKSAKDLLGVSPEELIVRTHLLSPYRQQVEPSLWDAATDNVVPQRTRFQALAALASLKSSRPDWTANSDDMVAELLTMNPVEMSRWLPAIAPIRDHLEEALVEAFAQGTDPSAQYRAAIVLGELFRDTPETLLSLVPQARPEQLAPLVEALKPRANFFAERLSDQLSRALSAAGNQPLTDEQASASVNNALALLGLGRDERVWPLLQQSTNEHLRTSLIHTVAPAGISWEAITTRMEWEQDGGVMAALCLTLGEYGEGELLPSDRERLAPGLLDLFRTHPHPGVHSAAEWVLRRWGFSSEVDAAVAKLKSPERDPERRWHVDTQGHTFAVIEPDTFLMGSPDDESDRLPEEVQHRRLIPRTFGIATREVTTAEYLEFDPDYSKKIDRRYSPDDTGPAVVVTWYDAVAFCNWLSAKEGLEPREMCYPPLADLAAIRKSFGSKSLELPDDLLDRRGYRLPTAAEWEYAARAGTVTPQPFGNAALASEYAWYRDNGKNRTWPTGLLKPNDLGLFDIQGNAAEWCQNYFFSTPPPAGPEGIVVDGPDSRDGFNRELRGGSSLRYPLSALRVAYCEGNPPNTFDVDIGFRLARTYRTVEQDGVPATQ